MARPIAEQRWEWKTAGRECRAVMRALFMVYAISPSGCNCTTVANAASTSLSVMAGSMCERPSDLNG